MAMRLAALSAGDLHCLHFPFIFLYYTSSSRTPLHGVLSCHDELVDLLAFVAPKLPRDKPNHLLGIADERSIHAAVPLGAAIVAFTQKQLILEE